jgi:serine/threonine-protein kinase
VIAVSGAAQVGASAIGVFLRRDAGRSAARALLSSLDAMTTWERCERRIGTMLSRKYWIERLLGVGGAAAVYEARHCTGLRVAVKVLHAELVPSREACERFVREAAVSMRVNHPSITSVLEDDVSEDGAPFLVMELLEGETLAQVLERRPVLPDYEVVPVACELLEALVAAHENGVVHRDVKPENVFLQSRGRGVKLLDFGIARAEADSHTTRSGALMGTPAFMAPEQALGLADQVDARTDVWAVGALLFRALSGHDVHEAPTSAMTVILAATQLARSLADLLPHADPGLARVVDRALAFGQHERWESAAEMLAALREVDADAAPYSAEGCAPTLRPTSLWPDRVFEATWVHPLST